MEGDFDAALRSYCAVLPRTTEPTDLGWILAGLAAAAAATGRAGEAARLWGASQRLQQEIDHPMSPVERGHYEKHLGSLDSARSPPAARSRLRMLSRSDCDCSATHQRSRSPPLDAGDGTSIRRRFNARVTETRAECDAGSGRACRTSTCPRQESNLRTRFRKPLLYPLSYGGRWGG